MESMITGKIFIPIDVEFKLTSMRFGGKDFFENFTKSGTESFMRLMSDGQVLFKSDKTEGEWKEADINEVREIVGPIMEHYGLRSIKVD